MRRLHRKKKPSEQSANTSGPFFKSVQTKIEVGKANDKYEVEADRMADAVLNKQKAANGTLTNAQAGIQQKPLAEQITPLVQKSEDPEAQTKLQRAEEEETQTKLQRAEEEEAQTKLQRMEEEEPQAKLQRMEEEEPQAKLQRMEEEEPQAKLQRMEEEEPQAKLQRMEEEEPQAKLQRAEKEEEVQGKKATQPSVKPTMEAALKNKKGSGSKMDSKTATAMESGFGADFSGVNIHTDSKAQEMSQEIGAQAFTHGNDVYFNQGKYNPESQQGKHLLAHELTHTIQQGKSKAAINKKESTGTPIAGSDPMVVKEEDKIVQKKDAVTSEPGENSNAGQQQEEEKAPEPAAAAPAESENKEVTTNKEETPTNEDGKDAPKKMLPETAVPTLVLTPPSTLIRGNVLDAKINFTPNEKGALEVTAWSYTTTTHGVLSRATTDANFQKFWKGVMADSGTLAVSYKVVNEDGTKGAVQQLSSAVTVTDRTTPGFKSQVDLVAEGVLGGKPSPPKKFSDLGLHTGTTPATTPKENKIKDGPNTGLTFVDSFTTSKYKSEPTIHPNLHDPGSAFHLFHQKTGILFIENTDGTGKRKIPDAEFSNLARAGGSFTYDVPDWEAYYKKYDYYKVKVSAGAKTKVLPEKLWNLVNNVKGGQIKANDDKAVRALLKIKPTDGYSIGWSSVKQNSANFLLPAARILSGTQSHEYSHAVHSHRANFVKMIRAVDPLRILESDVSSATTPVDFVAKINTLNTEIGKPGHDLVDEAASTTNEEFVATGVEMAGVNVDPATGVVIASVWDITGDKQMT